MSRDIIAAFEDRNQRSIIADLTNRLAAVEKVTTAATATPPNCGFTVFGQDGNFVVEINNPQDSVPNSILQAQLTPVENANGATVTHHIRSSLNRAFDTSGDIRFYGPDTKVRWDITDTPDQTRFWQLRSSYDGGTTWNKWKDFLDPIVCGVVGVWSGLVRSIRQVPNAQLNVTNYATVDTVPDSGDANFTIRIYGSGGPGTGWLRQVGLTLEGNGTDERGNPIPFPAASLPGYLIGNTYDAYYDKQAKLFRIFQVPNQYSQSLGDNYRFAGRVTIAAAGSDAVITCTVSAGQIVSVSIVNGGTDYTSAPILSLSGGAGADGALTCVISGGSVVGVSIVNAGSGYTSAPAIAVSGGRNSISGGGGDGGGPTGGGGGVRGLLPP